MNTLKITSLIAVLGLAPLYASAVNATQQPINTRFAQTQNAISIEASAWSFSGVELDEVDEFDGWSAAVEIVLPLPVGKDNMQVRLFVPFHTDGEAESTDIDVAEFGQDVEIDGSGGVYEFAILQFEHQLFNFDDDGYNAAYYIGGGTRTSGLDTDLSVEDPYNHTGRVIVAGIKYDRPVSDDGAQWLINAGIRHYTDADDLHPDGEEAFTFLDLKAAYVFAPFSDHIIPVIEVSYLGDFDYNALAVHPQLLVPFNDNVSLKLGGTIGLGGEGNQAGGAASLTIGF